MPNTRRDVGAPAENAGASAIGAITPQQRRLFLGSLMFAASALAIVVATPEEALAACAPAAPVLGDTVNCTSPGPYGTLSWFVDDLTVVVGDAGTATTVSGATYGIILRGNDGDLNLDVYNSGSTIAGATYDGIFARGYGTIDDIYLRIQGTVTGLDDGIWAYNPGTGYLGITAENVYGTNGHAIYARSAGPNMGIVTTGNVVGGFRGIEAVHTGSQALNIDVTTVTGTGSRGIYARNWGTDLSITASGTVTGGFEGITARNFGSGSTVVDVASVYGSSRYGIFATNSGTDLSVSASGPVSGVSRAIEARNYGSGSVSVGITDASSSTSRPVWVYNSASGTDLSVTASGTLTGYYGGVSTRNLGTGATDITVNDVTTSNWGAIWARDYGNGITVNSNGTLNPASYGIIARNYNSGNVSINAGDVYAGTDAGIFVRNNAGTGSVSIIDTGTVSSTSSIGIWSTNLGSGTTYISANNVHSSLSDAIFATTGGSADDVTVVTTGNITGHLNAVDVRQYGAADISIGVGDATGSTATGIFALNQSGGGNIAITATGTVSGGFDGIAAFNRGYGTTRIFANNVSGTNIGVRARGYANASDINITTYGTIYGGVDGIWACNESTIGGTTTILTYGTVTGQNGRGIYACSTIVANMGVYGGTDGIYVNHSHAHAASVTTNDVVYGYGGDGIRVRNTGSATDIIIDANDYVYGSVDGIDARNYGSGTTTITAGAVSGNSTNGVYVRSTGSGVSVGTTGYVYGGSRGIFTRNFGSGETNISVTDVYGGFGGISATNAIGGGATNLAVTASGTVTGGDTGIAVFSGGSGFTTIDAVDVNGYTNDGFFTRSFGTDQRITVTGTTYGGNHGIYARNFGSGYLNISAADVTGATGDGIRAYNDGSATDIRITATGTITGGVDGIDADNLGSGATVINAIDVTGGTGDGINVNNDGTGTSIATTGTVTGGTNGIFVDNDGTGAISISSTEVTGTLGEGIYANNGPTGTNIDIGATGSVYGGVDGIDSRNFGSGDTSISVVDVTGNTGTGIRAYGDASTRDMTINATSTITGAVNGVFAQNFGNGTTEVFAVDVTGTSTYGIYALGNGDTSVYHPPAYVYQADKVTKVYETLAIKTYKTYGSYLYTYPSGVKTPLYGPYTDVYGNIVTVGGCIPDAGDPFGPTDPCDFIAVHQREITDVTVVPVYGPNPVKTPGFTSYPGVTVVARGDVYGGTTGIRTRNIGEGSTYIATLATATTTATVTGASQRGIWAYNNSTALDITISVTDDVSGQTDGIYSTNLGNGSTTISGRDVTGTTGRGVYAYGDASSTNIIVGLGEAVLHGNGTLSHIRSDVTGGTDGVFVRNLGTGSTVVSAIDVVGGSGRGIDVYGGATTSDLTVSAGTTYLDNTGQPIGYGGTVTGYLDGIRAINTGTGATTVNAINVISTTGTGIVVAGQGTELSRPGYYGPVDFDPGVFVAAQGDVNGFLDGINVTNTGYGSTSVIANTVTGQTGRGIYILSGANTTTTTALVTGAVYGFTDGIWACGVGSGGTTVTTQDVVTGKTGDGIYACSTINAGAYVYGGVNGINVNHMGTDGVTINAVDVYGKTGNGINVDNPVGATYVRITDTATVTGGVDGIEVDNLGSGETRIDSYLVYGKTGRGIDVRNDGTYIDIDNSNYVYGYGDGIYARSNGSGAIDIDVVNVTTDRYAAIFAFAKSGTDVEITSTGTVAGGNHVNFGRGIYAWNAGTGQIDIDAVDVSGQAGAIFAVGYGTNIDIDVTGTATSAGGIGIYTDNRASGFITINAVDITGGTYGIYVAGNDGTYTQIDTTGAVYGGITGMRVRHDGSGALGIDAVSSIGGTEDGINVYSTGTDVTLTVSSTLSGAFSGAIVSNHGSGDTTINIAGANGTAYYGAWVYNKASAGSVDLTSTAHIHGGAHGVYSDNRGTGHTDIDVTSVSGGTGNGILALNFGTYIDIDASGYVYGGTNGIIFGNYGTGAVTIDTAAVTGAGLFGIGGYNGGTDLIIQPTGNVTGGVHGINVVNSGSGLTDIDVGNVYGTLGAGVNIGHTAAGDLNLDVTTYAFGGADGVVVSNTGTGASYVNVAAATGLTGTGIYVRGGLNTTYTNVIATGAVYGGTDGINACGLGSGGTYIRSYGTVTGKTGDGIYACSTVIAGAHVYGGTNGIYVNHLGTDGVIISGVSAHGGTGDGVRVMNPVGATYVDIDMSSYALGGAHGINVINNGSGATTIETVDATGGLLDGIRAYNYGSATGIEITSTGTVTGYRTGIAAVNNASGPVTINAYNVYGTNTGSGVAVMNSGNSDITVTVTGGLSGAFDGVYTNNLFGGNTTINVVGATGTVSTGIYAIQDASGGFVDVTATDTVTGGDNGIYVRNLGTGATTVSAMAVSGYSNYGIATNAFGTNSTINATSVYGATTGLRAFNNGSGFLDVDVTSLTGGTGYGGIVSNVTSGTTLDFDATGTVSGGLTGLYARNNGSGATTINTVATYGTLLNGIFATNGATATDLALTATGYTYGGQYGMFVNNTGTGSVTILATDVTGSALTGMRVQNSGTDTTITTTGTVTGGITGINSWNENPGNTSIYVNNVYGGANGVVASNTASADDILVTATGNVVAGSVGIAVTNLSNGATTTVNVGTYTYGATYGVYASSVSGTTINVENGEIVNSPGTAAIWTNGANDVVNTAGTIAGNILTNGGTDTFSLTGGVVTGTIGLGAQNDVANWHAGSITGQMLGGANYDILNVHLTGGGLWMSTGTPADLIDEFEELNFHTGDWYVNGTTTVDYFEVNFLDTGNTLIGDLDANLLTVGLGASLNLGDGAAASTTGNFINDGTLSINGTSVGTFDVGGSFDMSSGDGTLMVDVPATGNGDLLTVTGGVNLAGTLDVNHGPIITAGTTTLIDGGTFLNGTFDTVNGLFENGLLLSQSIIYDNSAYDVLLSSEIDPNNVLGTLSVNHGNVLGGLMGTLGGGGADPDLQLFAQQIGGIQTIEGLNEAARELYPGVVDGATIMADDAQRRFNRQLQNESGDINLPTGHREELDYGMTVWASMGVAHHADREGRNKFTSFEGNAVDIRGGVNDIPLWYGTRLGLAAGITRSNLFTIDGGADDGTIRSTLLGATLNVPVNGEGYGLNSHVDGTFSFAWHGGELDRHVLINTIDFEEYNQGHFSAHSTEIDLRWTFDGVSGHELPIRPLIVAGGRAFTQETLSESGGITRLEMDESNHMYRYAGLGAEFRQDWSVNHWFMLRATGMTYLTDEQNEYFSEFALADPDVSNFRSVGEELGSAIVLETSFGYITQNDFLIGLDGWAQFSMGDDEFYGAGHRENVGGTLRVSKNF